MLYLVRMDVNLPADLPPAQADAIKAELSGDPDQQVGGPQRAQRRPYGRG